MKWVAVQPPDCLWHCIGVYELPDYSDSLHNYKCCSIHLRLYKDSFERRCPSEQLGAFFSPEVMAMAILYLF